MIDLQIEKDMFITNKRDEIRTYSIEKNIPFQIFPTTRKTNVLKRYSMIEKLEVGDSFLMAGSQYKIDAEMAKIRKWLKETKSKIVLTKKTKPIDLLEELQKNYCVKEAHKIASNYSRVWIIE